MRKLDEEFFEKTIDVFKHTVERLNDLIKGAEDKSDETNRAFNLCKMIVAHKTIEEAFTSFKLGVRTHHALLHSGILEREGKEGNETAQSWLDPMFSHPAFEDEPEEDEDEDEDEEQRVQINQVSDLSGLPKRIRDQLKKALEEAE